MAKMRDKETAGKMNHDVFVDYADLKGEEAIGDMLPSHLPAALTKGLKHAKLTDKMISIVDNEEVLDQVMQGEVDPYRELAETTS